MRSKAKLDTSRLGFPLPMYMTIHSLLTWIIKIRRLPFIPRYLSGNVGNFFVEIKGASYAIYEAIYEWWAMRSKILEVVAKLSSNSASSPQRCSC